MNTILTSWLNLQSKYFPWRLMVFVGSISRHSGNYKITEKLTVELILFSVQSVQEASNNKHTGIATFELILVIVHINAVTAGWPLNKAAICSITNGESIARKLVDRILVHTALRYAQKWDLDAHCRAYYISKGAESRPYKCSKCGRGFTQLKSLHTWKVVCTPSFHCPHCNLGFNSELY